MMPYAHFPWCRPRRSGVMATLLLGLACIGAASAKPTGVAAPSIGILPFVDATRASTSLNPAISQALRSELVHATKLDARLVGAESGVRPQHFDAQGAVGLGRTAGVDYVLLGTVLEASAERRQQGGRLPRIRGQSATAQVRTVSASVSIQVELYSVRSGERVSSFRVNGSHTDAQFGGTLHTSLGQLQSNSTAFMESPLGRALQKAITELTRTIDAMALT
jgi:curli biogenesis system outer membrane secretion channel CsgG